MGGVVTQGLTQGEWDRLTDEELRKLSLDAHQVIATWEAVSFRADLELARRHPILVPSEGHANLQKNYEVIFDPVAHCTCPGFMYRATCRHLEEARKIAGAKRPTNLANAFLPEGARPFR